MPRSSHFGTGQRVIPGPPGSGVPVEADPEPGRLLVSVPDRLVELGRDVVAKWVGRVSPE